MKNEMRLQGIGLVEGTPAGELKVGDITRWNFGGIERITSVEFSKTGKTVVVGIEYMSYSEVPTGKIVSSTRTFRVTRLVNVIGSGNTVIVSDTRFESKPYEMNIGGQTIALGEEVVQVEEAPAVKEFTIYRKNDVHIVSAPQGEFALTIGGMFNVDYKDEHGEYFIENLLFMGSGPANDCLLFKNEREDILHMDPLKVQRVTIPFPKEHETVFGVFKEEPKEEVIEYRSFPYSLPYFSPFREIAVIDGNEFGYFVRKDEHGEMEYKVMAFHSQNSSNCSQVLAYESDCEGLERCLNNFLSKGFQFGVWKMKPQKVRVKVIDNKKEREEKLITAQSKVDRFERYRDILDKSLSRKGLTDEEREEMVLLYNELELSDGRNYYILAKAADTAIKGGAQ